MQTLHEDKNLTIQINASGEVFIKLTNDPLRKAIRVTPNYNPCTFTVTAATGQLTPTSVNGLPAFVVFYP